MSLADGKPAGSVIYGNFATGPYERSTQAGLGRRASGHRHGADPFHHRPSSLEKKTTELDPHADATTDLKPKVDIKDLSFFYGATKSLKNVTLPLYDRKVTAFIGPSGCGKSTLLRVINRMYELYPQPARRKAR